MLKNHPRHLTAGGPICVIMAITTPAVTPTSNYPEKPKWINRQLAARLDVFAYFNNDSHGYAVKNAARLKTLLQSQSTDKSTRR